MWMLIHSGNMWFVLEIDWKPFHQIVFFFGNRLVFVVLSAKDYIFSKIILKNRLDGTFACPKIFYEYIFCAFWCPQTVQRLNGVIRNHSYSLNFANIMCRSQSECLTNSV